MTDLAGQAHGFRTMGLGFELAESMTGNYHLFVAPLEARAIRVRLRLGVDGLRRFLKHRRITVDGLVHCEGLAENDGAGRPVSGSIAWRLIDEKRVPYDLAFEGDDGHTYRLRGQRDFFMHNVMGSLTTMEASLYDDRSELEIGRAVVHFEPAQELPALLKTFRPRVRLKNLLRSEDD